MAFKELDFLKGMLLSQGIEIYIFQEPYALMSEFDKGLRGQLYSEYDYTYVAQCLDKECRDGSLYVGQDTFGVSYVVWAGSHYEGKKVLITVGPYLDLDRKLDLTDVMAENHLELYHMAILEKYYAVLPKVQNVEVMMHVFLSYFVTQIPIKQTRYNFGEKEQYSKLQIQEQGDSSMHMVEERYKCEDALLEAVERGDLTQALLLQKDIKKYGIAERSCDRQRANKNWVLTLNVMFRRAVCKARVHPAHIDELSSFFAQRIEASQTELELRKISSEMLRKYCHLVQRYSLKGYSELIENTINYIDFHLKEPLTLNFLARELNVNASYLSAQFKRETQKNVISYINEKRIQEARTLLVTTNLAIQDVAARVGIFDVNYFSRLFKKIQQCTPREYRNAMCRREKE